MADELTGLDAKLLRGMLPGLYKQAQDGDGAAQGRVLKILDMLRTLEKDQPAVGFTAPPAAPGQSVSVASKTDLDARLAAGERQEWEPLWRDLMHERVQGEDGKPRQRWDWRKALYIAWRCTPANKRQPPTVHELATQYLGLHNTATIRHWRDADPEMEAYIAELPRRLLMEHVADVLDALVTVASEANSRAFQDRRLFLEMVGLYSPRAALALDGQIDMEHSGEVAMHHDLSGLSDDELEQLEAITAKLGGGAG